MFNVPISTVGLICHVKTEEKSFISGIAAERSMDISPSVTFYFKSFILQL